ncbi:MAG TPA: prepilin-type N-terminal cleavage/methylation domain-containing protein [Bacilli bacterium]|nr:prepilin-type N-terminal cleavage/methylation domain-containing protein [Bacilli bacterium]
MKKGYTLVELLAVIVILSILFFIAYAGVSQYLNYSNDKAFTTYENNLKSIAEEYVNSDDTYTATGSYDKCLTINYLISQKYIKEYVTEGTTNYLKHYNNKEDYVCDGYVTMLNDSNDLVITPFLSCGKYENSNITVDKETTNYDENIRNNSCEQ